MRLVVTPLVPAHKRQKKVDLRIQHQPDLQIEFQVNILKLYLQKQTNKQNKALHCQEIRIKKNIPQNSKG